METSSNTIETNILEGFKGHVIIIKRDKIIYGEINDNKILDHEDNEVCNWTDYLIEARFYNDTQEIKFFKKNKKLCYRIREDKNEDKDKNSTTFDDQQILSGTYYSLCNKNKYLQLTEDRGNLLYVPVAAIKDFNVNKLDKKKIRIALNTINYIEYKNHLATITDSRYVNYKII